MAKEECNLNHAGKEEEHVTSPDQSEQISATTKDVFNFNIGIPNPALSVSVTYFKCNLKFTSMPQFFVLLKLSVCHALC
jgi:hypothetical protein